MTKKIEDLKTIQETEDNQITELSDKDLDNVVGGYIYTPKTGEKYNNITYTPKSRNIGGYTYTPKIDDND